MENKIKYKAVTLTIYNDELGARASAFLHVLDESEVVLMNYGFNDFDDKRNEDFISLESFISYIQDIQLKSAREKNANE